VVILFAILVSAVAISYRGTPLLVAIMAGVLVAISVLMARTDFGRRLYAIGGNPSAARYAGINGKWYCFLVFLVAGALYGLAGLMLEARIGVAVPDAGTGLELTIIAAAVIGGTSLLAAWAPPSGPSSGRCSSRV
jgi:ABC-type xylose transport system permease subunit